MSEKNRANRFQSTVEGRDLVMEQIFPFPRELVFKAFSDSAYLAKWWGPKGWQTEIRQFEFQPKGIWLYCMKCTDKNQGDFYGQESWGKAFYHEIINPGKIVYTDTFVDPEGQSVDGMPEILVTINFIEQEGKTKVITHSRFTSCETLQQVLDMGVVEGFASQSDRLQDFLSELQ